MIFFHVLSTASGQVVCTTTVLCGFSMFSMFASAVHLCSGDCDYVIPDQEQMYNYPVSDSVKGCSLTSTLPRIAFEYGHSASAASTTLEIASAGQPGARTFSSTAKPKPLPALPMCTIPACRQMQLE